MYKIKTMNSISPEGILALQKRGCAVGAEIERPDGLLLRSAELHETAFGPELLAIARAGAGTNNIPVEACAEQGIVVFNSPGANAEAVKEQQLCSLILASRDVIGSIEWVRSIADRGDEIPELVEKGKASFGGPEIPSQYIPPRGTVERPEDPVLEGYEFNETADHSDYRQELTALAEEKGRGYIHGLLQKAALGAGAQMILRHALSSRIIFFLFSVFPLFRRSVWSAHNSHSLRDEIIGCVTVFNLYDVVFQTEVLDVLFENDFHSAASYFKRSVT